MERFSCLCGFILSVSLILAGCNQSKTELDLLPDEVKTVEVIYMRAAETTTWEVEQDKIAGLEEWVSALSLEHQTFEEGKSPGDSDGGAVCDFNINEGESSFSYVITGKDRYIVFDGEWYFIYPPSDQSIQEADDTILRTSQKRFFEWKQMTVIRTRFRAYASYAYLRI